MKSRIKSNNDFQELYQFLEGFKKEQNKKLLSIILPVYNEEKTIEKLLIDLPLDNSIEVIVIDDNSLDNSWEKIKKVSKSRKIILVKHKINKGYGGAITTGINYAKGKVLVTMDSDGQHCPSDILSLIKPIFNGEADYTIGSRYLGRNYYNLPLTTRLGEAIIEILIQVLFGPKVKNNQNGFRAFNRKLISLFESVKFYGFASATELIIKAAIYKNKIKECPIKVYDREHGTSKIILGKLTLDLFSCLFIYFIKKVALIFNHK